MARQPICFMKSIGVIACTLLFVLSVVAHGGAVGGHRVICTSVCGPIRVELLVAGDGEGEHLIYQISKLGRICLSEKSAYENMHIGGLKEDLKDGDGVRFHWRSDGKALVIEEYVGAASAEGDPIYIDISRGVPIEKKYKVRPLKGPNEGESRVIFRKWRSNGDPIIERVRE